MGEGENETENPEKEPMHEQQSDALNASKQRASLCCLCTGSCSGLCKHANALKINSYAALYAFGTGSVNYVNIVLVLVWTLWSSFPGNAR